MSEPFRALRDFLLFAFFRFCLAFLPSLLPMLSWFRPTAASEPSAALAGPVSELPPYIKTSPRLV